MLTEVRDTLLALYERRNDFNADNQIVVDGYTNFVFCDLYGRVYSNHRIIESTVSLKELRRNIIKRNTPRQNKKTERKIPFPRSHVMYCGIHSVRG